MRLDIYNYFLQRNNNNDKRQDGLSISVGNILEDRRNNATRLDNKLYSQLVGIKNDVNEHVQRLIGLIYLLDQQAMFNYREALSRILLISRRRRI